MARHFLHIRHPLVIFSAGRGTLSAGSDIASCLARDPGGDEWAIPPRSSEGKWDVGDFRPESNEGTVTAWTTKSGCPG
ncbi:hypothetical protein ABZT28_44220 [Streptomyces sp. NPDC005388]|uniref:hypothetical protein n=1 Tax=Streptomyces sp. NPDC005388 TaxID=3156717 RepID=UPI0033A96E37